jgi:hypothetical protein
MTTIRLGATAQKLLRLFVLKQKKQVVCRMADVYYVHSNVLTGTPLESVDKQLSQDCFNLNRTVKATDDLEEFR